MYRMIFASMLGLVAASCSPEAVQPEESVEHLTGEELADRVTRDLETVDDTNPESVEEAVVAISQLESVREMNRRMDEVDRLAAERRQREAATDAESARILNARINREARENQERIEREASENLRAAAEEGQARYEEDVRLLDALK